jgi:hypothetical protein
MTLIPKQNVSGLGNSSVEPCNFKFISATDEKVKYEWKTDSGLEYEAIWTLYRKNDKCYIDLNYRTKSGKSYTEITNRGELYRIMSTVAEMYDELVSNFPEITHWVITPEEPYYKMHPKKYKMYLLYLKKRLPGELIFDEYERAIWKLKK